MSKITGNELDPDFLKSLRDPTMMSAGTFGNVVKAKTNTEYTT